MSIVNEIKDLDIYWDDLFFTVCKGNVTEIKCLKTFDIFDIFSYIERTTNK